MKPKAKPIEGAFQLKSLQLFPIWLRQLIDVRYRIPYHIYTSCVYPIPAPNGSQIIICGHEHGLMVLWRGGRPLKPESKTNQNTNRKGDPALMVLDSDNEEQPSNFPEPNVNEPEYEDEEAEFDHKEPYHPIIQDLNLVLGTAVLHLSSIDVPYLHETEEFRSFPPLFHEKLVVALSCSDRSIKILTLPLSPPSVKSKMRPELLSGLPISKVGYGTWGEQTVDLNGSPAHQTIPTGISITLSSHSAAQTDLLITSHSTDISGLLLIHKITVPSDNSNFDVDSYNNDHLWRAYFLTKPAITAQLHVPMSSAQRIHPSLLVAEENGPVRIIDCQSTYISYQDSCLLSLYPGFLGSTPGDMPKSRQILDAKWVLEGDGIAIISADGEWGIWDIRDSSVLSGGIPTKFTVNGWMGSSSPRLDLAKVSMGRSEGRSILAPMTPGTRKVKQDALFAGTNIRSSHSTLGGIFVRSLDALASGKARDESMVIWHGDHFISIPSLQTYWKNAVKRSGHLLGTGSQGRIRERNLPLGGELSRSVTTFPLKSNSNSVQPLAESDLLITAERSLLIIACQIRKAKRTQVRPNFSAPVKKADQQLLARGELGVDGMDRILADMVDDDSQVLASKKHDGDISKRKVMFASSS